MNEVRPAPKKNDFYSSIVDPDTDLFELEILFRAWILGQILTFTVNVLFCTSSLRHSND
jgi:hypothetical protein